MSQNAQQSPVTFPKIIENEKAVMSVTTIKEQSFFSRPVDLPKFIEAFSSYSWPLVTLIIFLLLRNNFKLLINRVSKINGFGGEAEFSKEVEQFSLSVSEASTQVGTASHSSITPEQNSIETNEAKQILLLAKSDTTLAILKLSTFIEKELRILLATNGWHNEVRLSLKPMFYKLQQTKLLSSSLIDSIDKFIDIRNKVSHGSTYNEFDIQEAVLIGLDLLNAIKIIPHEKKIVFSVNVNLYSNHECTRLVPDAKGVILQSYDKYGAKGIKQIFPTTKSHFVVGKQVAWEWSMSKVWNETWYRDDNDETRTAWSSSAEFVGRNVEDV